MSAKVTLKVITGNLPEKEFVFEERSTCIMGRADDCFPKIPDDEAHRCISRYHCLLDINPPEIRVRDFGSLNGTYVNEQKIGQRNKDETPEEAKARQFPEYDLKTGDTIKLSDTILQVDIKVPDTIKITPPVASSNGEKPNLFELVQELIKRAINGEKKLQALKDYTLLKKLGTGGFGAVYLARHPNQTMVALKVMLPEVAQSSDSVDRFLREVANTKALNHPNIVQLLDFGYDSGTFFFTLEYCEGGSLQNLITEQGNLPIEASISIILQVLEALEYAHQAEIPYVKLANEQIAKGKGLVHRDIKPDNILFIKSNSNWQVKVADFGLAKAFDLAGLSGLSATNGAMGTPVFMPRQQALNCKYSQPEVDVWATAATLYYMLTGNFPRQFTTNDPLHDILKNPPTPIRQHSPSLPKKLADLIDFALQENPEIRLKTAKDFKEALLNLIN